MKPLGPIPPGFEAIGDQLAVGGHTVTALVDRAGGTPLFVYSAELIRRRMADLRAAMPARLKIHYAVKANPYRPILELMRDLSDGFDIASGGELDMVLAAGQDPARVSFAGPGKLVRRAAGSSLGAGFRWTSSPFDRCSFAGSSREALGGEGAARNDAGLG